LAALVGQKLVDGVLLMEVQLDDARVAALRELDIPFALIGRTRDVTGLHYVDYRLRRVGADGYGPSRRLGHHRIVLVNGSQDGESFASYGPYVRSEIAYRELCHSAGSSRGPALPTDGRSGRGRRDGAGGDGAGRHGG
jgi:DNA-binding LacI/PurR family transcriptional regulator